MEELQSYVVKGVDTGKGEIEALKASFIWGVERRKTDIC